MSRVGSVNNANRPRRRGGVRASIERRALLIGAIATALVLLVVFYYPVATVFVDAVVVGGQFTLSPLTGVLTSKFYLVSILWFTVEQALVSTLASLALGLPGAWILARFEFPGRRTLRSLTILPFILPSIMVAIGFVVMFGSKGTMNTVLASVGLPRIDLLYTLPAIVVANAFYNAPLVTRVTTAAWESVDARAIETARSLGANPRRAFLDVVLPQLLPSILVGATLTFVFTFQSFAIVLALGGFQLATVEVWIFQQVQNLDYANAASLAVIETAVTLTLTYLYLRYEARQRATGEGARPQPRRRLRPATWTRGAIAERAAVVVYAVVVLVVFVGPLASMLVASVTGPSGGLSFANYRFLLERQVSGASFQVKPFPSIVNSLEFAVATLVVALPMGVLTAVLTTRRYRGQKIADALLMAPLAVSGVVVGLGLLRGLVFGIPIAGTRLQVTGPIAIVAAHTVVAYPFVTRNVAPQLARLDRRLVESARSLGASRFRALVDVELPLVWTGVVAGAAFAFAISIGEFNATVILATGSGSYTMPVAIERFLGRRLGPATAMGCVLLLVTSLSFVVIERFGGRWGDL